MNTNFIRRRARRSVPTAPPAAYEARLENVAKANGLALGDPIRHKETKQPLGRIKKIDARGIHTGGKNTYHPDWVEKF